MPAVDIYKLRFSGPVFPMVVILQQWWEESTAAMPIYGQGLTNWTYLHKLHGQRCEHLYLYSRIM